ncbi:hypothetical protein [Lactobacillus sp. ESL0681]|uniref:hypothetical protein n=1 Tax=Lactobacillus sp. ESL0681 TaxID=2983211 RepID=UPI0023F9C2E4|nr:hypothetical protein [Lactobacillus sp. ESL0681]WEV41311.1 hypothetical protein OZX59_09280 [Lactobacillus sp. ESL0681]
MSEKETSKPKFGYYGCVDKEIEIHFIDKTIMKATLKYAGKYELLVETNGKKVSVFKGAIKYIAYGEAE